MQKPNGSFGKKVFAAGLAITTALWASAGLFVFAAQAVEAHPAGTLVLSGSTVWHISDDGAGRHGFDSLVKFQSHRFSFAKVVPANSADLALPDLGLMPLGHGVLFNDAGTVFQVAGGTKHGFTSAANFTGNGFSFANVVNGSLSGVTAGATIDSTSAAHMEGTFVNSAGTVWMVTATGRKGISSPGALFSYGAGFADVVAANSADLALAAEGNATFRTGTLVNDSGTLFAVTATTKRGFPSASCYTGFGFTFSMPVSGSTAGLTAGANYCADEGTVTPPPPSTSAGVLTASLASDTPAAATIVQNAARVGFTKLNLTAGASDVIVDSMEIERTGLSQDSNFSDIILLDVTGGVSAGLAAQVGNEKNLGSTHKATINDDITVKAGQTKSLLFAGNMAATLQSGEQASLQVTAITLSGSATLSGTLPLKGNAMTMNNTIAIATVTIAAGGADPSATTQRAGTNDYTVSAVRITIGAQEDMEIQQLRFYQNGTAADEDVKDLELMLDGSVIGTVAKPTSKEARFKLAAPVVIKKGESKEFSLRLDIVSGSSRTISMDFEKRTDVVALGKTFGYYRLPTYPSGTTPYYNANNTEIGIGTLTFSKGVVGSLNVAEGVNNQALGAFKVTVEGEPIQVTRLVIGVTSTALITNLTNLTVKDGSGNVVAGPVDPAVTTGFTMTGSATSTDTVVFPVGTNTYTIYGNLNTSYAVGDTLRVEVRDPSTLVTAKGTVTNQTVTPGPTSQVNLDTLTVKGGLLLVSTQTTPAAQTIVIGKQDHTFANYVLDAQTSGEDIRVTQMALVHKTSANSIQTNISNLEMVVDGVAQPPNVQPTAAVAQTATSTFAFVNPILVMKGTTKVVSLRGDVNAGSDTQTHSFGCASTACISSTGKDTGVAPTVTVTNSDGQVMTLAPSGTLTVAGDASNPSSGLLTGGSLKTTVQVLSITAGREAVDLTDIHFEMDAGEIINAGALNDEFTTVYLFDVTGGGTGTQIASRTPTTTDRVTFTSISSGVFRVTPGSPKKLAVKVDVGAISDPSNTSGNTADSGDGVAFEVDSGAYAGTGVDSGSAVTSANKSGSNTAGEFTVYKSIPTYTQTVSGYSTLANTGGVTLFKFKVAADAKGDLAVYKFSIALSTSTATVTDYELFEAEKNGAALSPKVNLTSNGSRSATECLIGGTDGKGSQCVVDFLFDTDSSGTNSGVARGGEFRFVDAGGSKLFEVTGTVTGSAAGSAVTTVMRGDNAFVSTYPNCAGTGVAASPSGDNVCNGVANQEQGNFVWSDLPYASTSSTATNTAEWFNGFRAVGMSVTSTSVVLSR